MGSTSTVRQYGAFSAAWNGCVGCGDDYGYGYHVIIAHDDGSQTLYVHFRTSGWQGQYVGQGEWALWAALILTGTHLHFEIHIGGYAVDPLAYLP